MVADFLREIHIDAGHFVFEDKPTGLADEIAVVTRQDSADRQRSFQQDLCRVVADFRFFSDFGLSEAVWMVVQQIQNAKFHHQAGNLEHNRCKSDFLSQTLSLACGQVFVGIALF